MKQKMRQSLDNETKDSSEGHKTKKYAMKTGDDTDNTLITCNLGDKTNNIKDETNNSSQDNEAVKTAVKAMK
jgi:hypothetical protein